MALILFGCGVSILLFTGAQLPAKGKQPVHYCMITGCFAVVYVNFYFWAVETGLILRVPALALSDITATIISIPSFYLAALSILYEGKRPVKSYTVYFIVPVVFAVVFGFYNAFTAPSFFRENEAIPSRFGSPVLLFITAITYLALSTVIVLDLLAAHRLHKSGHAHHTQKFYSQVVFLFCYLAASFILHAAWVLKDEKLVVVAVALFSIIAVFFLLTSMAVSFFSQENATSRPRNEILNPEWDASSDELSARLDDMMEQFGHYRDPELTLAQLAEMLGEEPKRLSYYFNVSRALNFRRYINDLRLKAVCRDLIDYPERTILHTAFANGFNSKSSFNTLFFKTYGKTPREFRKERTNTGPPQPSV